MVGVRTPKIGSRAVGEKRGQRFKMLLASGIGILLAIMTLWYLIPYDDDKIVALDPIEAEIAKLNHKSERGVHQSIWYAELFILYILWLLPTSRTGHRAC